MRAWGEREDEEIQFRTTSLRRKSTGLHDDKGRRDPEHRMPSRRVTLSNASDGPRMHDGQRRQSYAGRGCGRDAQNRSRQNQHLSNSDDSWTTLSSKADVRLDDAVNPRVTCQWITVHATKWYLSPQVTSCKLGELPQGRVVVEVPTARPIPHWVAIQPRGFVLLDDVAPAETPCAEDSQPADMPAAAYNDELRIREHNLTLREQSFAAKQELDSMLQARNAMAQELATLEEKRSLELQKLEGYRQRKVHMKEKLERCSEVVAFTVNTMDQLHDQPAQTPAAELAAAESEITRSLAELDESADQIYVDSPERVTQQQDFSTVVSGSEVNDIENQPSNVRLPTWTATNAYIGADKKQAAPMTKLAWPCTDAYLSKGKQPASRAPLQALNLR
mmetsp:Transcript_10769/g.19146  ORF Transcript_10769/g.19146 Transcript_10769/m.19146 type:complete len:390 (+) Transcript_10769:56-1225(+)